MRVYTLLNDFDAKCSLLALQKIVVVCLRDFSLPGRLHFYPTYQNSFISVHRWAYGILLWEVGTLGM